MYSHEMQKGENNKAQKHNTSKAVTFPKKNELPQMGNKKERSFKQQGTETLHTQGSHFSKEK